MRGDSLLRRVFLAVFGLALRIFFRRVEVSGLERVPTTGPVIFAVNHPNALIDPLLLLCLAPRRVSFLAKAALFRMPVIGFFVRAFDSIPVQRRQDAVFDSAQNLETFARARALLAQGGAIAIFPEGVSHSDPKLRPVKTGAARIALGAAASGEPAPAPLQTVPTGLYYTAKGRFRSSALLSFGDPLPVASRQLGSDGEPPEDAVRELTERVAEALSALTLQAESREALELIRRAERIVSWEENGQAGSLAVELNRRRLFVEGAARLRERDQKRFAAIERRIARFESERREARLSLEHLTPTRLRPASLLRLVASNLLAFLLLPLAALGALLHYPAYRLAGFLAVTFAPEEEETLSTIKVASSLLLFPVTWLPLVAGAAALFGKPGALAAAFFAPLSGYAALLAREGLDSVIGRARALSHLALKGHATRRLLAQRRAIREEILRAAREMGSLPQHQKLKTEQPERGNRPR